MYLYKEYYTQQYKMIGLSQQLCLRGDFYKEHRCEKHAKILTVIYEIYRCIIVWYRIDRGGIENTEPLHRSARAVITS